MEKLNLSIETIYLNAGQYDAYCSFDFHRDSEAAKKYGGHAHGIVVYTPKERKRLDALLECDAIAMTEGCVKLDTGSTNKEIKQQLLNEGFNTSDVSNFYIVGGTQPKVFKQEAAIKEIPNTITIDLEDRREDWISLYQMELHLYRSRLKSGTPLIPFEIIHFNCLVYILNGYGSIPSELINPSTGKIYDEAEFIILGAKYRQYLATGIKSITPLEYHELKKKISKRKSQRITIIRRQLGISNDQLQKFEADFPDEYNELLKVTLRFEDEVLVLHGFTIAVFWDFDRFIHIMLRHYRSFHIAVSTNSNGTKFQYMYKDVLRLIKIVLEQNRDDIESTLKQGKEFRKYHEQGFYYNGNYYTFRIGKDGKLMQFHPQS
ncbi:hypothetical protein [Pedobacter agri]|uniref:hypothetical protein n=1 Tax=Pedobacter agri TaxID=454586 RepID=UPI00292D3942|nr:hypothetical protein [Pedobacter agri]